MGLFRLSFQEESQWNIIKINDRVDLILEMQQMQEIYTTRVGGINKDMLLLEIPRIGNSVLEIRSNTEVTVNVYTDKGIIRFKSRIVSQDWSNYTLSVSKPRRIEQTQRRSYYRLNTVLPVHYGVITNYGLSTDDSKVAVNLMGVTKNISEGGMLMVIDRIVAINTTIKTQIIINNDVTVKTLARILEQKRLEEDKFLTRAQFIRISGEDMDAIRKFVVTHAHRLDKI